MKQQKAGTPKVRADLLIPLPLDRRLKAIMVRTGASRTQIIITALEQFIYGEEQEVAVDTVSEQAAVLTTMVGGITNNMLEMKAYLDAIGQKLCGSEEEFQEFLAAVETVKTEIGEAE